jgi:hypothetical protein
MNNITYEEVKKNQSSAAPFAAAALFYLLTLATPSSGIEPSAVLTHVKSLMKSNPLVREDQDILNDIQKVTASEDLADDGEVIRASVVTESKRYVAEAAQILGYMFPAVVSAFFGEVNVTWQNNDSIVRLACFPNRPTVIQTGVISVLGSYRSIENPEANVLAKSLEHLFRPEVSEESVSG